MADRGFTRVPCAIEVRFRSPSAFLIAYATNLSRGGLFLAIEEPLPPGTTLALTLAMRGAGPVTVEAEVTWVRKQANADGPVGMGLAFADLVETVGGQIDGLVGQFRGIKVALLARDGRSSAEVGRALRSAISSADLIELSEASFVETFGDRCDLLVVDADSEPDGGAAAIAAANEVQPPLPTIVLSADPGLRAAAASAGATALTRPPSSAELGRAAVIALSTPLAVRAT